MTAGQEDALNMREWWSAEDIQRWLGIGRTKSYEIVREMTSYSVGRLRRVHRDDLREWLARQRCAPGE
jgi:excisionase family DNA binding protein